MTTTDPTTDPRPATPARRSTPRDYARLLAKLAVFSVPIAAFCAAPIWALDRVGELRCLDIPQVAKDQAADNNVIYGPAYTDCAQQLKMEGTLAAKTEVLLIGTSRSLQVRKQLFRVPFYNAGAATSRAGDLRRFLAKIPENTQPRVIVVLLDQFLLNADTDAHVGAEYRPLDEALTSCVSPAGFVAENWPRVWRDLLARKVSVDLVLHPGRPDHLGVRAKVLDSGYRGDGSFRITGRESFDEVRDRMAKGKRRYEPGTEPSAAMVEEIEGFLVDAAARKIRVVAILPPYAPTIYDEMQAQGRWTYVDKVHAALAPRFAAHGHTVWDYSDTRSLGLSDAEFYDGFHPSERACAAIFADVAKKDEVMAGVVDSAGIARMMQESTDPLSIVPER